MPAKIFRYVKHHLVEAYAQCGWVDRPHILKDTHHGVFSTVMEWPHDRPSVEPLIQVVPEASALT